MEFEQCRSLTGVGDGFSDDFGGAVDEEALLGAGDGGVEELACGEGAVGFFGQYDEDILVFAALGAVDGDGPGGTVLGELGDAHRFTLVEMDFEPFSIRVNDADFAVAETGLGVVVIDDDGTVDDFLTRIFSGEEFFDLGAERVAPTGLNAVRGENADFVECLESLLGRGREGDRLHGLEHGGREVFENLRNAGRLAPKKTIRAGGLLVFGKQIDGFFVLATFDGEGELGYGRAVGETQGFGEVDAGGFQCFRSGDFGEDISATDAFELVRVAKKDEAGVVRQGLQKGLPEHRIDHGALVHNENFARKTVPVVVGATVFTGIVAKQ